MARIAVFSLTYHPFIGGAEVAIAEIATRCRTHQFTVFTARLKASLPERETIGAVTVVRVGSGSAWDKFRYPWIASRAARREHAQVPFQIVWGMMASWGGWAALKFKEACPSVPYVLTEQSGDSDAFIAARTWFWQSRYRHIYTRADRVTAISQFLAERAKRFGAAAVVVIPNGVDVAAFGRPVDAAERQQLQRRLRLTGTGSVVLTVSRLVRKNGVDDIIRAVNRLRQPGKSVTLLIAGTGPLEPQLRELCKQLRCVGQVQFLGHVEHAKLPVLLSLANVFVRPSRSEGFGNVFVEAMAAGIPVVATPVGGIVDFLRDGENGYLAQPDDPASVAQAIQHAYSDPNRDQLIQRAKETACQYDWNMVSQKMNDVFSRLAV